MPSDAKIKLCECGCGQPTKPAKWSSTRDGYKIGEPVRFVHTHRQRLWKLPPETKKQNKKARRQDYLDTPEGRKKAVILRQRWRNKNLEWASFIMNANRHGITLDQFHAKYESQDFVCAICGDEMVGRFLHIDHDHSDGSFRGILCHLCNVGLGAFKDSPERLSLAIGYLT